MFDKYRSRLDRSKYGYRNILDNYNEGKRISSRSVCSINNPSFKAASNTIRIV